MSAGVAAEGGAVVTLTAAGAIDATYRVGAVRPGAFMRASAYTREVSGKGVNVSAALALAGRETVAVVVLGADDLDFAARSHRTGVLRPVAIPGATRVNTSIIDDVGVTTKVNAPTPPLDAETWAEVVGATLAELDRTDASWLVVSGTVPQIVGAAGGPADLSGLLSAAHARGIRVAVDSSGPALARIVAAPRGVSLVKPNADELAEVTGRALRTLGDVAASARAVIAAGVEAVYASLGVDGVLVVTASGSVHARAEAPRVANTAGAGDASLAGFLVGLGAGSLDDPAARARAASAAASWGAHAVAQPSTILPDLVGLPSAAVTPDPDPATPLAEPAVPR